MAGVVTSQYPSWPVQITAYGLASAVGLGRIALDAHWASDIFVSAVLGIAVSKAVVHLNRKRAEKKARGPLFWILGILVIAALGVPLVLAYTVSIYWIFRGKVKLDSSSY